mmetsp:Transcript_15902/g.30494  ORF Transcript_15902/g.30494 Transcript_15902/m.30494 type:complete len:90 (+) Transcript_15902:652-921(+)
MRQLILDAANTGNCWQIFSGYYCELKDNNKPMACSFAWSSACGLDMVHTKNGLHFLGPHARPFSFLEHVCAFENFNIRHWISKLGFLDA